MAGSRYVYRGKPDGFLATSAGTESVRTVPDPFYEGLVVDVILDHMHHQYATKDGYNVGAIKVRIFSIHNSRDDELLDWADPLDSAIQEMPLIGELVMIHKVLGNFFYTKKVFLAHRMQENGMLKLNDTLNNRISQLNTKITATADEISIDSHKFGEYFKPDSRVRQLKHFEGDLLIQGRMGHSIRFGSSKVDPSSNGMSPNIILRTGQGKDIEKTDVTKDSPFGLILEDINKDAASIWMTSDQTIPFQPTTVDAGSFKRTIQNGPHQYDGAQIIANSDRLVLNAKKTHVMLFANEEIYLNSFKNTSIDSDSSIVLTANLDISNSTARNIDNIANVDFTVHAGKDILTLSMEKTSLLATKIYMGSIEDDKEPMVGGMSLSVFLARLLTILMGTPSTVATPQTPGVPYQIPPALVPSVAAFTHVITPVGPGALNPLIQTGLAALYAELAKPNSGQKVPSLFAGAPFNSGDNFVNLGNEVVKMELNKFSEGTQIITENNKWILADKSYYKVI
jgi:hypothetical protein